jgi:LysR family transcriptional regulator for metE and metH
MDSYKRQIAVPIDTRHLVLLTAIVEEGSVTAAARRLHLTQPALSHQLHNAEEELGAPLFERINKKMLLTPAGNHLLKVSRVVLEELRVAEKEIRKSATDGEGRLRISTECYTCYHWLPARLRLFHERFPRVEVQIVAGVTRDPLPAVLDGRLDLAIVADPKPNRRLEFHPLFEDEVVAVMAPGHPLSTRTWIRPEDFADQHYILYSITREESSVFQQFLNPAGVTPRQVSHIDLTEAILEMVRAGLGITVLARWAVAPLLASGELHAARLTRWGIHRKWCAALRRYGSRPAHLDSFVDLLQKHPISLDGYSRKGMRRGASPDLLCKI